MRSALLVAIPLMMLMCACGDDGGDGDETSDGDTSSTTSTGNDCPPDAGGTQAEADAAADALCVAFHGLGERAGCTVNDSPRNICYSLGGMFEEDVPGCEAEAVALLECEAARMEAQAPETCECKEPSGQSCSNPDPSSCDAEESAFEACRDCP